MGGRWKKSGRRFYGAHPTRRGYGPRYAAPEGGEDQGQVLKDQHEMNEVLRDLFDGAARELNEDGIRGPATSGVEAAFDTFMQKLSTAFPDQRIPASRAERMAWLKDVLKSDQRDGFLTHPKVQELRGGLKERIGGLDDTPNGFKPGTGFKTAAATPPDPAVKADPPVKTPDLTKAEPPVVEGGITNGPLGAAEPRVVTDGASTIRAEPTVQPPSKQEWRPV